jgi:membrane protease YdiL (CAAX protease family)
MLKGFKWKTFWVLFFMMLFGNFASLPYLLMLSGISISSLLPESIVQLVLSTLLQQALFTIVLFLGMVLSQKIGMGAPLIESWSEGKKVRKKLLDTAKQSVKIGVLVGVALFMIDAVVFAYLFSMLTEAPGEPYIIEGFLASFYGGIVEEILMRLFLMSLFVWITFKIKKTPKGMPTNFGIWVSIILSSIIFGIGHLSAAGMLTPVIVTRVVILNGIAGVAFGWLYWKRGLEASMMAHFSADIMLHVVLFTIYATIF